MTTLYDSETGGVLPPATCEHCDTVLDVTPDGWFCRTCWLEWYDPPFGSKSRGLNEKEDFYVKEVKSE
jgi:hypothetical protein